MTERLATSEDRSQTLIVPSDEPEASAEPLPAVGAASTVLTRSSCSPREMAGVRDDESVSSIGSEAAEAEAEAEVEAEVEVEAAASADGS